MFDTEEECKNTCSEFMPDPASSIMHRRSFGLSLLLFCFGALAICALFGAISSMCLYIYRRNRRSVAYGQTYISACRTPSDKIFLVGPKLSSASDMKPEIMSLPPTYSDVLLASKDEPKAN